MSRVLLFWAIFISALVSASAEATNVIYFITPQDERETSGLPEVDDIQPTLTRWMPGAEVRWIRLRQWSAFGDELAASLRPGDQIVGAVLSAHGTADQMVLINGVVAQAEGVYREILRPILARPDALGERFVFHLHSCSQACDWAQVNSTLDRVGELAQAEFARSPLKEMILLSHPSTTDQSVYRIAPMRERLVMKILDRTVGVGFCRVGQAICAVEVRLPYPIRAFLHRAHAFTLLNRLALVAGLATTFEGGALGVIAGPLVAAAVSSVYFRHESSVVSVIELTPGAPARKMRNRTLGEVLSEFFRKGFPDGYCEDFAERPFTGG